MEGANELMPDETQSHPYLLELDTMDHPYVNAFINNISFPTGIEELEVFVYEHGMYNIEEILTNSDTNWTVPRSAKIGDIVLFYHAKTAISRITSLITRVAGLSEDSGHDKPLLLEWLERGRHLYKKYGGKIFAVGRVTGLPEYWQTNGTDTVYHWRGRIYADIGNIAVIQNPVDIREFNSFIKVSRQSAITPLPRKEFLGLRDIIFRRNDNLPAFFLRCQIGNFNLSHINSENFLLVTKDFRRRFLLEIDFRSYYVDYLLNGLTKRNYWCECTCHTEGKPNCYVDNVFLYNGKYYLMEVKLNIQLERNLVAQLEQYIHSDYLLLDQKTAKKVIAFERKFMYVIDTEALYHYDAVSNILTKLISLDDVHCIDDIKRFMT